MSVLSITQVRFSFSPCLLLPSLVQQLAACCLFPPAFNLGFGLRGMNPADFRLFAAAQLTALLWNSWGTVIYLTIFDLNYLGLMGVSPHSVQPWQDSKAEDPLEILFVMS